MADVKIFNIVDDGTMTFEITDIDVCIVNSMRRVMMTHIKMLVFRGPLMYRKKLLLVKIKNITSLVKT